MNISYCPTIAVCSPNPSSWRWYEADTIGCARWLFYSDLPQSFLEKAIKKPSLSRIRATVRCVEEAKLQRADAVVAHSVATTLWTSAAMRWLKADMPLIAYSFNMPKLYKDLRFYNMRKVLTNVRRFVVHSQFERQQYSRYLQVPIDRFDVVRWGVEVPNLENYDPPLFDGSYICAIGKDRRDYGTLVRAMEKLPHLKLVIVAHPYNLTGINIPSNVEVLYHIPLHQAMNILKYSQFMALPLDGEDVACGHITLVWSMLYRKAFVATKSAGITDYIPDKYDAPQIAAFDVDGWVNALREMADDLQLRQRCEDMGAPFARIHCSHEAALKGCCEVLRKEGLTINLEF